MRRIILSAIMIIAFFSMAQAQNAYWVFFTDKSGSTFDPYSYFDAKAVERYRMNGVSLPSNTPASSASPFLNAGKSDLARDAKRWNSGQERKCTPFTEW